MPILSFLCKVPQILDTFSGKISNIIVEYIRLITLPKNMSKPYNKISKDLKNQILERVKTSGKFIAEISEEHGIGKTTIYEWLRESTGEAPQRDVIKLERENRELKQIIGELTVQLGIAQKKW